MNKGHVTQIMAHTVYEWHRSPRALNVASGPLSAHKLQPSGLAHSGDGPVGLGEAREAAARAGSARLSPPQDVALYIFGCCLPFV